MNATCTIAQKSCATDRHEDATAWKERTITRLEDLTREDVLDMLHGHVAGLRLPALLTPKQCARVVEGVRRMARRHARRYEGGLNIGTPLNLPSHWEFKYTKNDPDAWFAYFRSVGAATRRRRALFRGVPDPVERVLAALGKAWGAPVEHVRHPRYGWRLYAGMIRSGAPRLHFDWAPFDLDLKDVVLQAGANVYLANFAHGGDLRVYRTYGMTRGARAAKGVGVVGNYDLPRSLVRGTESRTLRCGVGDLVVSANRFLHEVTPGNEPEENRLVLSFHLALKADGKLVVFS